MIRAESISYEYPGVLALDNVSLEAEKGQVVALVGPNGAGKTTLLRCLAALERPISGRITIDGIDAEEAPRVCHAKLGYLRDLFGLYDNLSAGQCLTYAAAARGIAEAGIPPAVKKAAESLQITNFLDKKAGELSRGLRQRLAIAQAIVHAPKVLLLDEPASGLDPEARHSLSILFKNLAASGMTLVVSSHILTELEEYSTSMLIMNKGRVVPSDPAGVEAGGAQGEAALKSAEPVAEHFVRLQISLVRPVDDAARFSSIPGVSDVKLNGTQVLLRCPPGLQARHEVLKNLILNNVPVCGIVEMKDSMHSAYLKGLGRARDGATGKN